MLPLWDVFTVTLFTGWQGKLANTDSLFNICYATVLLQHLLLWTILFILHHSWGRRRCVFGLSLRLSQTAEMFQIGHKHPLKIEKVRFDCPEAKGQGRCDLRDIILVTTRGFIPLL